jgi:hypothetical protein
LILPAVAPTAAHGPGRGGKARAGGPSDIISAERKIAAAARYEFTRLRQLDDAPLLAGAGHGKQKHSFRSIESVSLAATGGITNHNMVAIRIPHVRHSDIREAAETHRGRPRPDYHSVVGNTRPANESRTAVARPFA